MPLRVTPTRRPADIDAARQLLAVYFGQLRDEVPAALAEQELAALPAPYDGTEGTLLLAWSEPGRAVGCVGIRKLDQDGACELKRLYVAEAGRQRGVGRALVTAAIEAAAALGYRVLYLDTLSSMTAAIALYRSMAFEPVAPYHALPSPGLLCFRKPLG